MGKHALDRWITGMFTSTEGLVDELVRRLGQGFWSKPHFFFNIIFSMACFFTRWFCFLQMFLTSPQFSKVFFSGACQNIRIKPHHTPLRYLETTDHLSRRGHYPRVWWITGCCQNWGALDQSSTDGSDPRVVPWIGLQEGGLMEAWNFENPDLAVQPGDRFAEAAW